MPIPAELQQALENNPLFDPSIVKSDYTKNKDLWELYLTLLELDGNKLKCLVEKHSKDEDPCKFELRQKLSAVFNLVPTLVNMIKGYIFAEEPTLDVKGDPDLEAFLANCDGAGTSLVNYIRETVLPLCSIQGVLDVLVQLPLVIGSIRSKKEAEDAGMVPTLFPITLKKRINWSSQTSGAYNWICFEDAGNENPDALLRDIVTPVSYITVSAANPDLVSGPNGGGFWIRSWRPLAIGMNPNNAAAGPGTILPPTNETDAKSSGQFLHEADWTPTERIPVATIYWQKSNDPDTRHAGVSKIAVIAILTKLMIQVLSWSTEDVLSNLALLAIGTEGGKAPKKADGTSAIGEMSVWSMLFFDKEGKHAPFYVQGSVDHIKIKLEFVDKIVEEILRIAHMIGVSGRGKGGGAGGEKSGFHAVVNRTELIQELKDTASNLDRFTMEVLALAKSWATGEDWDRDRLTKEIGPTVDFFKGPWQTESVADVLSESEAAIELFREISPSLVEAALKKAARAYLYSGDPAVADAMKEIEKNTGKFLESQNAQAILAEAAAIAGGRQAGTMTVTETSQGEAGGAPSEGQQAAPPATPAK